MLISDIVTLIKNGFTHDEIMEISRGTAAPVGGTPEQTTAPVENSQHPEQIEQPEQTPAPGVFDVLNDRLTALEIRVNSTAVANSEQPEQQPAPTMTQIMESYLK